MMRKGQLSPWKEVSSVFKLLKSNEDSNQFFSRCNPAKPFGQQCNKCSMDVFLI